LTDGSRHGSANSDSFAYHDVKTGENVDAVKPVKKGRRLAANKVAAKKYREKRRKEERILRDRITFLSQNNETLTSLLELNTKRIQELEHTIQQLSKGDTLTQEIL